MCSAPLYGGVGLECLLSRGTLVIRTHNVTEIGASSTRQRLSAKRVSAESSRLQLPATCTFPERPAWCGE
jgi:hypothetical protein